MTNLYGAPEFQEYEPPQRRGGSGTLVGFAAMAVGVFVLIVAFTIIPIVGSELQKDTAGMVSAGSNWNSSYNPDIPTASSVWATLGGIIKVGGVVVVVAGFFKTVQGVRR